MFDDASQPAIELRGGQPPVPHLVRGHDRLSEAVDRLERKRSRPVNFFFLAAVLKKKGLWPEIQRVKSINGKTPDELERKVSAQAKAAR